MHIKMTRELAYAIGLDEANRSMHAAGRKVWNDEDYAVGCETFRRVWPLCVHQADPDYCGLCLQENALSINAMATTERKRKSSGGKAHPRG